MSYPFRAIQSITNIQSQTIHVLKLYSELSTSIVLIIPNIVQPNITSTSKLSSQNLDEGEAIEDDEKNA